MIPKYFNIFWGHVVSNAQTRRRKRSENFAEQKNPLPLPGFETQTVHPVAQLLLLYERILIS